MDESTPRVADRVGALLANLSRAERQVGRVLLADYPSAGLSTAAGLAQQARVSPPTVLRFAQSLGYDGFTELQKALRQELTLQSSGPLVRLSDSTETDSAREVVIRHARAQANRTVESLARIPEASYEAAVTLLVNPSKRIVLTGGRFSHLIAFHLGLHLEQLRPGVRIIDDPQGRDLGTVVDLGHRDVLVLFDFHRYQVSAQELAESAQRRGATIILVTDSLSCPVAPRADVVLDVTSVTDQAFQSMAAAFTLSEQLLHLIVDRIGEPAHTRLALWDRSREREFLR
ncbi:MAG: MurR/RpiR family transcriptional regulator [Cryobacterium sp.]|jgi:DNA-binding MurR/RpiR family transcriptional regulator|nr:MurR/RpiR family transcriptional regulator [Cryobacterium sp.]